MKKLIPAAISPVLLLAFAVPAFAGQAGADRNIDVQGKYTGDFQTMHTLILGKESSLSLDSGQTMTVNLTNSLDQGLRMVVTPTTDSGAESYAWLSGQTAGTGTGPYGWHVAFYDGDKRVPLDGEAVIRLSVPAGYGSAVFYYMDNSGNLSAVRTQKSGNYISFTAQNSGYYLFLKPLSSSGGAGSGSLGSGSSRSGSSGSGSTGVNAGTVSVDSQKGYVHSTDGILTGAAGGSTGDGYSHWILDSKGWRLRYADGTWASGSEKDGAEVYAWEKINGSWYLFGSDSYARFGWHLDTESGNWYHLDVNTGMKTGWHEDPQDGCWYYLGENGVMAVGWRKIGGKWHYFNAHAPEATWEYSQSERGWKYRTDSTGRPYGSMYQSENTPDGYYVDEDGVWDGTVAGR